jgi:hypothetical protein
MPKNILSYATKGHYVSLTFDYLGYRTHYTKADGKPATLTWWIKVWPRQKAWRYAKLIRDTEKMIRQNPKGYTITSLIFSNLKEGEDFNYVYVSGINRKPIKVFDIN